MFSKMHLLNEMVHIHVGLGVNSQKLEEMAFLLPILDDYLLEPNNVKARSFRIIKLTFLHGLLFAMLRQVPPNLIEPIIQKYIILTSK